MDEKIKELKKIIDESNNIVFFGGAGVSTESGIPDFRSANGIYNMNLGRTVSPEEMISHSFYMRHTEDFYEFYKDKLIYEDAQPNNCHKALAELERQGKVKAVVTQNIDGLHQKAGSKVVCWSRRVYRIATNAAAASSLMLCSMKRDSTATSSTEQSERSRTLTHS